MPNDVPGDISESNSNIGFDINEELKKLPELPGVYIMKDTDGNIIYIGKSICLKNRVRSYFQPSNADLPKHKAMVPQIKAFEYIVTDNEVEALILECNLIKKHRPHFNVTLKDNRTYPYIKLTLNETFPRVLMVRHVYKDNAKYYGPYPTVYTTDEVLNLIRQLWPLRMCDKTALSGIETKGKKGRACLNFDMGMCKAPCNGSISKDDYDKMVSELTEFLNGKHSEILKRLEREMMEAAESLDFERAAMRRNQIFAVKKLDYKQKLDKVEGKDRDIVAFAKSLGEAMAQLFFIRDGKMTGREHHIIKGVELMSDSEIMLAFVMQFYDGSPDIPPELVIQTEIDNLSEVSEILSKRRGGKVIITVPQRGEKAKLVAMAKQNAVIALERYGDAEKRAWKKAQGALGELADALGVGEGGSALKRIEAYDISNVHGFESVGSMVVYEHGKPKRTDYRKFKIKTVEGADDYASIEEVLTRRFSRYLKENGENEKSGKSFSELPDALFIDGGKGHVTSALAALQKYGLDIPVCGMVKDDKHKTRGIFYNGEEITLPRTSEGFKLLTRIQDEVHRFAVEYHRKLREKAMVKSELDDIKGVGDKRKKALLKHFGSIDEIKLATVDEMCEVSAVNRPSAQAVYDYFH